MKLVFVLLLAGVAVLLFFIAALAGGGDDHGALGRLAAAGRAARARPVLVRVAAPGAVTLMWGSYYWPRGLIVVSVAFAVPELYALFTNTQNTLSWYCRRELGVRTAYGHGVHSLAWWFSIAAWALFVAVITGHIWFGKV